MFELDMTAIRRTAAIHSPNVANPANRLIASEGLANRWLTAANAVANPAQISHCPPELAKLATLAISHDLLTARLIAAAMRRCDQFNDSDKARQDMREQMLEIPLHQCQEWLDYFNQETKP